MRWASFVIRLTWSINCKELVETVRRTTHLHELTIGNVQDYIWAYCRARGFMAAAAIESFHQHQGVVDLNPRGTEIAVECLLAGGSD